MSPLAGVCALVGTLLTAAPGEAPRLLLADTLRFPRVQLVVDPGTDAGALSGLAVVEGAGAAPHLPVTEPTALPPWSLMVVVDAGPAGAGQREAIGLCLRVLAESVPPDARLGLVTAGDSLTLTPAPAEAVPLAAPPPEAYASGRARLLDGILAAAQWARDRDGPRAIVVLSAGPDTASYASPDTLSASAPYLGVPIFSLQIATAEDPVLAAIATGSGGASAATARRDLLPATLRKLLAPVRRAVGLTFTSPDRAGAGLWRPVAAVREGAESAIVVGGYSVPADEDCVRYEPRIECPCTLPPSLVALYDETGAEFRAWLLSDRAIRLPAGTYRALLGIRPGVRRAVVVDGRPQPPLAALCGLRLSLPPQWPKGLPYRLAAERGSADVGLAWSGEWLPVPPGVYSLRLANGATYDHPMVALAAGRRREIDLSDWAALRVRLATAAGAPAQVAAVFESGDERRSGITGEQVLLPPGVWDATVATRPAQRLTALLLEPCEARSIDLPPLGSLRVALRGSDGRPTQVGWVGRTAHSEEAAATGVTNETADIAAGALEVEVLTTPRLRFPVEVVPGEAVTLDAGHLVSFVVELLGVDGKPLRERWTLIDSGTGDPLASGLTGRPSELIPGEFDVEVWTRPHRVLHNVQIRSDLGQYLHLGQLGAIRVKPGSAARLGAYREEGDRLFPAAVVETGARVEVLPGEYVIRSIEPAAAGPDRRITVLPGQVVEIEPPGAARQVDQAL